MIRSSRSIGARSYGGRNVISSRTHGTRSIRRYGRSRSFGYRGRRHRHHNHNGFYFGVSGLFDSLGYYRVPLSFGFTTAYASYGGSYAPMPMFGYGTQYYADDVFAGAPVPGYVGSYDPYGTAMPYQGQPYVDYGSNSAGSTYGPSAPPPYVEYGAPQQPSAPNYGPAPEYDTPTAPAPGQWPVPDQGAGQPHAPGGFPAPDANPESVTPEYETPEHAPAQPGVQTQPGTQEGGADAPHPDFKLGVDAWQARNYAQAREHFSRVAGDEPNNGEAWLALMHTFYAEREFAAASAAMQQAAPLGAFPRGYRFNPAGLYESPEAFESLRADLHAHVDKTPADIDSLLLKSYFHVAMGEQDDARRDIRKVQTARPGDKTSVFLLTGLLPAPAPETSGAAAPAPTQGR